MTFVLTPEYAERVYAGVLGKLIGVYLGRPFEQWSHARIVERFGAITYYVNAATGTPLVVADDDISGTFTFLRALADYGHPHDLTPEQIGRTWLNYLIEGRTVLWWGGLGMSTEHTAYLRLKAGIPAPRSGSLCTNGPVVAQQIGAQIFIDGWAMVAPGDPALAADLARRAASVSHDGEAIYGAQVIAAMEALAFVEADRMKLLDSAVTFIPADALLYRMIADLRDWHQQYPDWQQAYARIAETYNYERYGGGCHIIPNHALVILGLLYGDDDFQRSMMIVNTAGWDTDCNAGNLGCLLGIKNGLAGLDAGPDWRGPVADRLYLPTADGGRAISDALTEACHVVNMGRGLAGVPPWLPKQGMRYHFDLPGAVQGFQADIDTASASTLRLENVSGHSQNGARALALHYMLTPDGSARACTPTFLDVADLMHAGYGLAASPILYGGQTVRGRVCAGTGAPAVTCRLFIRSYDAGDRLVTRYDTPFTLAADAEHVFTWRLPAATDGAPIAQIGLELSSPQAASGTLYLDWLTWDGTPTLELCRPVGEAGRAWRAAWVNAVDTWADWQTAYQLHQNYGTGLLMQGARDWADYDVTSTLRANFAQAMGVAARVQGLRRYYALLLCADDKARLVRAWDTETVLAEADFPVTWLRPYTLRLRVAGDRLRAWVDDAPLFEVVDLAAPALAGGAVALVITEGTLFSESVRVSPISA